MTSYLPYRSTFDVVFCVAFFSDLVAGCHCTLHIVRKNVRITCTTDCTSHQSHVLPHDGAFTVTVKSVRVSTLHRKSVPKPCQPLHYALQVRILLVHSYLVEKWEQIASKQRLPITRNRTSNVARLLVSCLCQFSTNEDMCGCPAIRSSRITCLFLVLDTTATS
jgi:hypothetical protein